MEKISLTVEGIALMANWIRWVVLNILTLTVFNQMKMTTDKNNLNDPAGLGNIAPTELAKEKVHIVVE